MIARARRRFHHLARQLSTSPRAMIERFSSRFQLIAMSSSARARGSISRKSGSIGVRRLIALRECDARVHRLRDGLLIDAPIAVVLHEPNG